MIYYWRVLLLINLSLAFLLAYKGDAMWMFSMGMVGLCGYRLADMEEKNNERK